MQSEGVVVAIISIIDTAVVATTIVVAAFVAIVVISVEAFGSPLFGLLIPIIIISSGGRPRARATIVRIVATPIILRLWRRLLVVFALDALDACRPSNGCEDLLSFDGVARSKTSGRDVPSATDACGPLDGCLSSHCIASSIDGFLASSFDSKLLGGTMAATRVQNIA
jgi:hypothetical protein